MEFALFLEMKPGAPRFPLDLIQAHVERLRKLDDEGRLVAAGPFSDHSGGLILARFPSLEEAERFAQSDPFVVEGYEVARVVPWEQSHRGNGHLGVVEPAPDGAFLNALKRLCTARSFSDRTVDEATLRGLLDAALRAPSEFNLQPWRPVVCISKESRERLAACCHRQKQVARAGAAVIVAASTRALIDDAPRATDELLQGHWSGRDRETQIASIREHFGQSREKLLLGAMRNSVIFGHQLLLAAVSIGMAGFWLGGFDEEPLRKEFGIPEEAIVAGVIGLGWPAEEEGSRAPRLPPEAVVSWERWGERGPSAA